MKLSVEVKVTNEFVRAQHWFHRATRAKKLTGRERRAARRRLTRIAAQAVEKYMRNVNEMYACYINLHPGVM